MARGGHFATAHRGESHPGEYGRVGPRAEPGAESPSQNYTAAVQTRVVPVEIPTEQVEVTGVATGESVFGQFGEFNPLLIRNSN